MVQSYYDNTGLYRKYGPDKATAMAGGEYRTYGQLHEIELKIDLTLLASTDTIVVGVDDIFLPKARLHQVILIAETAATSAGSATLDIGLIQTDRTTAISATGLVSGLAKTALTPVGTQVTLNVGSTGAGASLGTTLTNVAQITAKYNTAAFTAGVVKVKIQYYYP